MNDPYVVDEYANVCGAVHELALARFREIVEFVPPSSAPSVPVTDSDEFVARDDVATVCVNPFVPVYSAPCPSDDSRSGPPNVDDAVEKIPFVNPIVVDVEL